MANLIQDPKLVGLLNERHDLTVNLYQLARSNHCPSGQPCDEDIECPECTLLVIAADELGLDDPFPSSA